jgi:hypothetical protein
VVYDGAKQTQWAIHNTPYAVTLPVSLTLLDTFALVTDGSGVILWTFLGNTPPMARLCQQPAATLVSTATLRQNDVLRNCHNQTLSMQSDGSAAIIDETGKLVASTVLTAAPPSYLVVQDDGNIVVYNNNGSNAVWSSCTAGVGTQPYTLTLQDRYMQLGDATNTIVYALGQPKSRACPSSTTVQSSSGTTVTRKTPSTTPTTSAAAVTAAATTTMMPFTKTATTTTIAPATGAKNATTKSALTTTVTTTTTRLNVLTAMMTTITTTTTTSSLLTSALSSVISASAAGANDSSALPPAMSTPAAASRLSEYAVAGIAIAIVILVCVIVAVFLFVVLRRKRRRQHPLDQDLSGVAQMANNPSEITNRQFSRYGMLPGNDYASTSLQAHEYEAAFAPLKT